ncbi:MAG: energy transducer TonB [Candidatus Baltobacteraceae bacterium]
MRVNYIFGALLCLLGCYHAQLTAPKPQSPRGITNALPTPSAGLAQSASSATKCKNGEIYTPAMLNNSFQQPDAFDKSGPGSATLSLYIDSAGRPMAAGVQNQSSPSLASAAIAVVQGWHFLPARCGKKTVIGTYLERFNDG